MPELTTLRYQMTGGYFPGAPAVGASPAQQATIRGGNNCWLRPDGRIEVANGSAQSSSTNVGARIFSFNTQRATIEGGLVSSRIPYAGLLRFQNAVMFYLSELTGKQVYLNESAATGVTTSSTAGMLRIAVPASPWNVYDAGFDPPALASGNVTTDATSTKSMNGQCGVALCHWRTTSNAISAPSATIYEAMDAGATAGRITIDVGTVGISNGSDGWIFAGTGWGDLSGALSVVRYVRKVPRGTFTAHNSSTAIDAGAGTFFQQDIRPGDVLTIDGADYRILTVDSQTAMTLDTTGGYTSFGGSTGTGKTATVKKACAEWRNGELGDSISYEVYKPVKAAGVLQYAGRVFLWGCYGVDSSAVTGPAIVPLLTDNPEHTGNPQNAILTANNDDILAVWAGETRLFVGTANTLESVTFTADPTQPYKVRILHRPGFAAAKNGVVYQDRFYGFTAQGPIRTVVNDNVDVDFGVQVHSVMRSWTSSRVVVIADPVNQAVLYCHYDGSATTTIIPYMAALGTWGPPHTLSGQIIDGEAVNGILYFTILTGGNYRVYQWEGGTAGSASSPYIVSQFNDAGVPEKRKVVKSIEVNGKTSYIRPYRILPNGTYPDITNTSAAVTTITTSGSEKSEKEYRTNIADCRAMAVRVDFPSAGSLDSVLARGYVHNSVY